MMQKKILTFSTGNLFKKMDGLDVDSIIDFLRPLVLDIDGYMVSFLDCDDISRVKLSDGTAEYLRKMKYNSIHAPVVDYNDDEKTRKLMKDMEKIYAKIKAKQVVFHPYRIKDFSILKNTGMNCLIEFMRPEKNVSLDQYEHLINNHSWLGFAHDICHAAQFSNETIAEVFNKFKIKTKQVHISFANKEKRHMPMFKATKDFLDAAECVKKLNVEFCIESTMENPDDIKKEARFCREWLKN